MNLSPLTTSPVMRHKASNSVASKPHFEARYRVNGETVYSTAAAIGTTSALAPEFAAPVMNATGLGSMVAPLLKDPVMAGLLTTTGGGVIGKLASELFLKIPDDKKIKTPEKASSEAPLPEASDERQPLKP
ncbi:MAG: hypothetical protein K2X66_07795 [Cyanobacteria bacterium]|nr:hypothetical protein [Cyanobacteriota bacterium]